MILVWTCLFAALGGFLFGYDLGLIGGALLQIQRYFHITSSVTLELIVGMAKLGAAVGTFLGGAAMARYGRKRALALNSIAFTLGPLLMALASTPWLLVLGRFIIGVGIGISATVSPAYIAELAPAPIRGTLVQLYEVMLCIGMLSAPLMDWALSRNNSDSSWRIMVGLPALPGLALAAAPLLLPESPRWLVTRNRLDEALQVLTTVMRGSGRLTMGGGGLWSGGYTRVADKDMASGRGSAAATDDQAVRDAEDELLQLWSCVELDRNAVMERRRKLWRSRQKQGGQRWGRLGCWNQKLGRPKPPSLEAIPEESNSQLSSPLRHGGLSPRRSCGELQGGQQEQLRQVAAALGAGGATAGALVGPRGAERLGAPPHQHVDGSSCNFGGMPGGVRGRSGSNPDGGAGSSGGASAPNGLFSGRRGNPEAYRPLAASDAGPDLVPNTGARERLLSQLSHSRNNPDPDPSQTAAGGPPASLGDMPGEESSFFRTLAALLADIGALAVGPERRALWLALGLAFFNQATASTAIINYAPTLLSRLGHAGGVDDGSAMLYTVVIGITKAIGVVTALLLVDHYGRRPLLVAGSLICSVALGGLTVAALACNTALLEVAMCIFTLFFSVSWAGLYWVVVSELFSMTAKSAATSAATGLLFLTGAVTDLIYLSLVDWMGAYIFLLFAALCLGSAVYVWRWLPETKGRTLAEVQTMLARASAAEGSDGGGSAGGGGAGDGGGHQWVQLWERRPPES